MAIVGGGPAGLSTALFLTHAMPALIDRIVVLEKARYPRDKYCAGGLGARADQLLRGIGVEVDVPSVPISGLAVSTSSGASAARLEGMGRVVRRVEFDHALAKIARAKGIRVLDGVKVSQLQRRSAGAQLDTEAGPVYARVVVGADGVSGVVRKAIGLAPSKYRAQVIELDTEDVPGDHPRDTLHFDYFDTSFCGYAWDFPTLVEGQPLVCRGIYHLKLPTQRADILQLLTQRLRDRGLDIGRYKLKRFAECGYEAHRSYAAAHVLLVGEAAGIDALSGEGIPQAIAYGAFAGKYLAQKLAEGDLSFTDWTKRLARSPLGLDLTAREWWMRRYFGPSREMFDRYLISESKFALAMAEQLAGNPWCDWHFARAATSAGGPRAVE